MVKPSLLLAVASAGVVWSARAAPMTNDGSEALHEFDARVTAQVITKCTVPGTVALTFDDGPSTSMGEVMRQLEAVGGKATFFVNGNNWGCIYANDRAASVKNAYDRGHQIASHTWAHKDLTTLNRDQLNSEFSRTDQAIQRITGAVPAFVRPPYGNHNALVRDVAGSRGQTIVNWDFDSGDSVGVSVADQKARYTELAQRKPLSILSLQHDVHTTSVTEVLPHAIRVLKNAGYTKFVTVADCLGRSKYQSTGAPEPRNSNWKC